MKEIKVASMPRTLTTLTRWTKTPLPSLITIKGDAIIKPSIRKQLKDEVLGALVRDLQDACGELVDVVVGADGVVVVVQHEEEGCVSFELNMKVKALDYDAWELGEALSEEPSNE